MKRVTIAFLGLVVAAILALLFWGRTHPLPRVPEPANRQVEKPKPVSPATTGSAEANVGIAPKPSQEPASDEVVTIEDLLHGLPPKKISRKAYAQTRADDQLRRDGIRERNLASGANTAVWAKEAQLRAQASALRAGLTATEVCTLLGPPTSIAAVKLQDGFLIRDSIALEQQAKLDIESYFHYDPTHRMPLNLQSGDGWQVLTIKFDSAKLVVTWSWDTPIARTFRMSQHFIKK